MADVHVGVDDVSSESTPCPRRGKNRRIALPTPVRARRLSGGTGESQSRDRDDHNWPEPTLLGYKRPHHPSFTVQGVVCASGRAQAPIVASRDDHVIRALSDRRLVLSYARLVVSTGPGPEDPGPARIVNVRLAYRFRTGLDRVSSCRLRHLAGHCRDRGTDPVGRRCLLSQLVEADRVSARRQQVNPNRLGRFMVRP